jgi:tripartite-type tricarboxylate transporter receptor subunit TctC
MANQIGQFFCGRLLRVLALAGWGLTLVGGLLASGTVLAASYPEKPVTLVIPFGPNSEADAVGRMLVARLKQHFPEAEIVVENRVGDSGAKGVTEVRQAAPDGYTLLAGSVSAMVVAPAFKPALPYRGSEFSLLGVMQFNPLIFAVRADAPYKDARELLAAIRKAPGTLKFGHVGPSSMLNLAPLYFLKLGGLKPGAAVGVGFPGTGDAVKAMENGELDFMVATAGTMIDLIRKGKVRPLFTTAPGRLADLPNVINAREAGFRDMGKFGGWSVLVGPPGMPAPVVAKWKKALALVAADPQWKEGLEQRGAIPLLGTSKDNERFMKDQFALYDQLITSMGLRD